MPKSRGSRGQNKNREKARDKPKQSRSCRADNNRSETTKEKRTIAHDLITGFKVSSHNPKAIKSIKRHFINNGNDGPKCPADKHDNHKQFIDGADNPRLSAECNHKPKGSVAFEFGNSRKPNDGNTHNPHSMSSVANAIRTTVEPRLSTAFEGNVAKPFNRNAQHSWNTQREATTHDDDRHYAWETQTPSFTATSYRD